MNEQRYLIEVLLRARESVSEIAQKAVRALDGVTEAQKRNDAASKSSTEATRRQVTQLEQLRQAHIREKKVADDTRAGALREASALRDLARARQDQIGTIDKTVQSLTRQAEASRRMADQNGRLGRSYERSIGDIDRQITRLNRSQETSVHNTGRFTNALERMGVSSGNARTGLRGLNAEFQGFQIALAVKYAQALVSALTALAAQFLAVASAAGQAAIGIGAAFGAAAAQAAPVVGVLIASFARLASILKVVKLQNDQQLTATHDATRAAKARQTANEQIATSERRVADAHRNTGRAVQDLAQTRGDAARSEIQAQREVTRARQDAIRTVQDLIAAEEDANQTVEQAREGRRRAIESGDVSGTIQADINLGRSRRDLQRARQDAAPVRRFGVEGVEAVQQAEQRLADTRRQGARQIEQAEENLGDARRGEREATQDLTRTRKDAAEQVAQETAAVDKLADSIAQLSPAERTLYRRILALQDVYRRVARPITDIITRAFTDVVDRIINVLNDPRISRGFRSIAVEVARAIRSATGEASSDQSVGAFQILSAEAARNIPIATRILINFFRAVRNLVIDAIPAFRLLLTYVEDYSERAEEASRSSSGIKQFFIDGVRYAKAFFDFGLAVVNLLLTLAGPGGAAAEGIKTIEGLTKGVEQLTVKARHSSDQVQEFFRRTRHAFGEILSVVVALGREILYAFSPSAISAFADFLNRVIIPALGNVLRIMGFLTTAFHQVFSAPLVADVAQMGATVLILARGLTVIRSAIGSVLGILPTFLRSMGLMVTATEGAAAGAGVLGTALSPAGLVVVGIAAVTAAIVLLDRKLHFLGPTWKFIREAASDAFDWIKHAARDVVDFFSDVWTQGLLYWIRYPFVWAAQHLAGPAFGWIRNAVRDVIAFVMDHFGPGGELEVIGDLIAAPFRVGAVAVRLAFRAIRTIIVGALDLIAGRFDEFGEVIGDFWAGFLDVGRGAISSLLGVLGDLLGALGKIPEIGGPFKRAAEDVRDAQKSIDNLRDSTKKQAEEQERGRKVVDAAIPSIVELRKRYDDAKDRLDKLTPGTKEYRQAVRNARDASKDYNDKLKDTADRAGNARQPIGRLRRNIQSVGDTSADTADVIAKNLNDVLRQVGARTIRLNTRAYRKSGIDVITEATGHGATGGALSRSAGIRRRMFTGGVPNPYGGAADDHLVVSPSGRPVAAISGTEGIINTPQMGVINNALSFTQQMTGMPWGSLNDLWGSGMRHFATGGGLHPAVAALSSRLNRMFGTVTTSAVRAGDTGSYHSLGLAADISGTPRAMDRVSSYLKRSGLTRALLEGIHNPGLSIKNGRPVPASFWGASTWADHIDHVHLALRSLSARLSNILDAGGIGRVRAPRIEGLGQDALSRIARGSSQLLTRAANRYLRRQQGRLGGADTNVRALGAQANVVAAFRRAIRAAGANRKERLALWEAGIVESGLKNLNFGDADSLGALQERVSIFGRSHALNPFASAMRFLRDAISRRPYRGTAGMLAADVQRPAAQFRGRYDQVQSRALRYLQGGGPIKGAIRGPSVTPLPRSLAGNVLASNIRRALEPAVTRINEAFKDIAGALETTARGPLRRSKNLALRIQRAFSRITGDGGLLDQMREQTDTLVARAAVALQRRQFSIRGGRPTRLRLTEAQIAAGELRGLRAQGRGLGSERDSIENSISAAERSLAVAEERGKRRAADAARAALVNLRRRLDENATALAQNAQDQVEAQERFQAALLTAVNDMADRQNSAIDRWSRLAKALGQNLDPNVVLGAQIDNMRSQISGLQNVLARAQRSGNTELVNQVTDQIADLNVQIAEAVAQQFQNSIDAVNNTAASANSRLDRRSRIAQLGGRTDFTAMQSILQGRGGVLRNQIGGLTALLGQAQSAGNIEQVNNLLDQIDELNTQLAENTQAIQDNTDAAFDFRTQQINSAFDFSQGVLGGAQGFFQAIAEATGIDTSGQQAAAMQALATALQTQSAGLQQQLAALTGDGSVLGLQGQGLVNYLLSIASGPAFEAIMARLDPTQQAAFKDLVTALLGNATATVQNTQALENIISPDSQSFSSSLWSTFRMAVFTGAGGLLPQYQSAMPTMPTANIGAGTMTASSMLSNIGSSGLPRTKSWPGAGGDTYHLNVTTPTEVLNPTDVGRQLAFYRKSQGKR